MSIAPPVALAHVTLAEWDADYSQRDDAYELVEGIPTVDLLQRLDHAAANSRLVSKLSPILRPEWHPLAHFAVHVGVRNEWHTVRQPDLTVTRRLCGLATRADPTDVALVAEIISDESIERDVLTKRREYARAGIPAYLLVDVRGPRPTVVLFDRIVDGAYLTPDTDGTAVTLRIGEHVIQLQASELVN